jgi:hypothetical protein
MPGNNLGEMRERHPKNAGEVRKTGEWFGG